MANSPQKTTLRYLSQIAQIAGDLCAIENGSSRESYDVAYDKSWCAHFELECHEITDRNIDDNIGDKRDYGDTAHLLQTSQNTHQGALHSIRELERSVENEHLRGEGDDRFVLGKEHRHKVAQRHEGRNHAHAPHYCH